MKKILLTVIVATFVFTIKAQTPTYALQPEDTLMGSIFLNDIAFFDIFQTNTSSDSITFSWRKISHYIPAGWDYSLCDYGVCFIGIPDSGTMQPVAPGSQAFLGFNVGPYEIEGTAVLRVELWDSANPSHVDTLTWIISTRQNVGINETGIEATFKAMPNPSINEVLIELPYSGDVAMYNVYGQLLRRESLQQGTRKYSVSDLPSGRYYLELRGDGDRLKRLVLQKQ